MIVAVHAMFPIQVVHLPNEWQIRVVDATQAGHYINYSTIKPPLDRSFVEAVVAVLQKKVERNKVFMDTATSREVSDDEFGLWLCKELDYSPKKAKTFIKQVRDNKLTALLELQQMGKFCMGLPPRWWLS